MLHAGQRLGVVLDAEVGHPLALAPEVGHQRVVGVQHEGGAAVERATSSGPAVGEQLELAVAVELVAEQVGEQQQARLDLLGHARQPGLVDLEQPELAGLAAGVEQGGGDPQAMLDPARLCTTGRPARSRQAASIAAVVVFPLVAETSSEPSSSSRAMRSSAPGERRSSSRPGAVVPPAAAEAPAGRPQQPGERSGGPYIRPGR